MICDQRLRRAGGAPSALKTVSGVLPRAMRSPGYFGDKDMQEWC